MLTPSFYMTFLKPKMHRGHQRDFYLHQCLGGKSEALQRQIKDGSHQRMEVQNTSHATVEPKLSKVLAEVQIEQIEAQDIESEKKKKVDGLGFRPEREPKHFKNTNGKTKTSRQTAVQ